MASTYTNQMAIDELRGVEARGAGIVTVAGELAANTATTEPLDLAELRRLRGLARKAIEGVDRLIYAAEHLDHEDDRIEITDTDQEREVSVEGMRVAVTRPAKMIGFEAVLYDGPEDHESETIGPMSSAEALRVALEHAKAF